MTKEIHIDEAFLREQYLVIEKPAREIAADLGINKTTVLRHLKRCGIKRRTNGEVHKGRKATPETRAKMSSVRRGRTLTEEHKKKISNAHRGKPRSDETKRKLSESKMGCKLSPEHRQKIAESCRKHPYWQGKRLSETHKKHMSESRLGEKTWNWQGGISFEPYCPKFNDAFREYIRDKFGRKCFLCQHVENGRRLSVHHTDYNKNSICNGKEWAFVPLCAGCHAKTSLHKHYYFNRLINYWAVDPEINLENVIYPF